MTARPAPFVTLLTWGILAAPALAQPAARAFLRDTGAHALVALDLASGTRTGVLPLTGSPTRLNRSDDGRYLVVLVNHHRCRHCATRREDRCRRA